jgi:hypothetical protein
MSRSKRAHLENLDIQIFPTITVFLFRAVRVVNIPTPSIHILYVDRGRRMIKEGNPG